MRDVNFSKVGKGPTDVIDEPPRDEAWVGLPRTHSPRPLQAVTSDNTIVIVGTIGVADRATIAYDLVQDLADRFSHHHECRNGQQSRSELGHQCAKMDVARQHHLRGTDTA